jgi:signal transduction histidine kinase
VGLPPRPEAMNPPGVLVHTLSSIVDAELPDSVNRLIRLRWLAGIGVLTLTLSVGPLFNVVVPIPPLLAIGVCILVYNLAFLLIERRMQRRSAKANTYQQIAIWQIVLDWIAATLLIHFSGGVESPAIFFFLFHVVIASIFFPPRVAYTFAAFALALLFSVVGLEYFALIPHYPIIGYLDTSLYQNPLYVLGMLVFFGWTGVFLTYLTTDITDHLRRREAEVVELSESLKQVTIRLQALNESARTISSTLNLEQVLNQLVKNITEVMGVRACSIRLLDKSEQRLEPVAVYGLSQAYQDKGPILLENSPLDREILAGSVVNIPDVSQSSLLQYPEWAAMEGFSSMLSAPLLGKNKAIGSLRAYSEDKNHFNANDETFLAAIAAQGSIAIENAIAYQTVEALENTKSTFIRTFTHELRSPVGVIRSLLRNITDGYTGEISAQQRDLLERAIRRCDFLQELIDDLLDLAAGKIQDTSSEVLEPVSLNAILEKVVKRYEIPAKEKGLALEWPNRLDCPEAKVMATTDGLDRVFNNLVSNAVKYTLLGGKATVILAQNQEDEVAVTVADTGIGIPQDAIEHLFTEFYRAPNARQIESKGTGLGLSIVKDIVTRFGGRINVQSEVGVGTNFTVSFPLAKKGWTSY